MKRLFWSALVTLTVLGAVAPDVPAQAQPQPTRVVLAPFVLDGSAVSLSDSVIALMLAQLDTAATTRDLRFRTRQDVNNILRQSNMSNGVSSVGDLRLLTSVLAARNAVGVSVEQRPSDYRVVATFFLPGTPEIGSFHSTATDLPTAARTLSLILSRMEQMRR